MELKTIIIDILNERKSKNSAYSMRALARDLKLDAGQLQRIIVSKREPTALVAFRVGQHLNMKSDELIRLIETTLDKKQ